MPSILIIEDDPDLATVLQHDLQDAGHEISHASSVMQGLTHARSHPPDLVILDLNLPDGNGRDVLTRLKSTTGVRVMILTAHDSISKKVELLNLGANDYLVKPYNLDELLARVAVQLRVPASDVLRIGDLELSPSKQRVTCNGAELRFGPTEFEILALLMRYPGKVYSREHILQVVWGAEIAPKSNMVDVHLANIRAKLRDAGLYRYLRTVRGVGYGLKT
jgi:two-component system copper resistance phosphate regulon response regulator CusR